MCMISAAVVFSFSSSLITWSALQVEQRYVESISDCVHTSKFEVRTQVTWLLDD